MNRDLIDNRQYKGGILRCQFFNMQRWMLRA